MKSVKKPASWWRKVLSGSKRAPLAHAGRYRLIIFDKDGTLIDFQRMWGEWIVELAGRLEPAAGADIAAALYKTMGYEPAQKRIAPKGLLAVASMAVIYRKTRQLLEAEGFARERAEQILAGAWFVPDGVSTALPLTDLTHLFTELRRRGFKIAIATSDDRAPTAHMVQEMGLSSLVDAIAGADDGLPGKPAPDKVLHLCRLLDIPPQETIVVGDTPADMQMGRAAGAGRLIGVLSGVSEAGDLSPFADQSIPSIAALLSEL